MFIELRDFGWNLLTLNLLLSNGLSFVGAISIGKQARRIRQERSGAGVSIEWNIVFQAMFCSWYAYGIRHDSLVLIIQGLMRVPFVAIVLARLWKYQRFSTIQKYLLGTFLVLCAATAIPALTDPLFILLSYLGAAASCLQPIKIWMERSSGVLESQLIAVMLTNSVLRLSYGFMTHDSNVLWSALPYVAIHTSTMILYLRFRPRI